MVKRKLTRCMYITRFLMAGTIILLFEAGIQKDFMNIYINVFAMAIYSIVHFLINHRLLNNEREEK